MDFILLLLFLGLLVAHRRLRSRVSVLEARLESAAPVHPAETDVTGRSTAPEVRKPAVRHAPPPEWPAKTPKTRKPRPWDGQSARLWTWLLGNWALAVAGVSLALAGIFLVQYGVEQGLLTPTARVLAALALGAALIGGGELLRRRHGDESPEAGAVAGLPSILSGAGVITLFAAILAARTMYGLIGPGVTLTGLSGVAIGAIVLGWFHGPVLTGFGLIGATAAPFLVGGASDAAWIFHYYFALTVIVGLAVDAARQWRWISVLALASGGAGASLLHAGIRDVPHYLGFWALVVLAAVILPGLGNRTALAGSSLTRWALARGAAPAMPAWLGFAAVAASSVVASIVGSDALDPAAFWLCASFLAILQAGFVTGARSAALDDLPVLPGIALLTMVLLEGVGGGPAYHAFGVTLRDIVPQVEEMGPSPAVTILMSLGAFSTLLFAIRMRNSTERVPRILWTLAAAVCGPAMALIFEFAWHAAAVMGPYPWALHIMAMAGLMTFLAVRVRGCEAPLRRALFAGAAIVLITLALFVMLSAAALTLAFAVMVLACMLIDRKFDLPLMGGLAQIGVALIGYRLVIDPGIIWSVMDASLFDVILAYLGSLLLLGAALRVTPGAADRPAKVVLESALWSIAAILACVLLQKWLGLRNVSGHAGLGLMASVWLTLMMVQLYRLKAGGWIAKIIRLALTAVSGLVAFGWMVAQAIVANPVFPVSPAFLGKDLVTGPPVFGSLMAAFLSIALVFAVGTWRLTHLPRLVRGIFAAFASGYAALWVGLEIRRIWQGPDLSQPGVLDGELYSYTLALVLTAAVLLVLSLVRRSETLRKIAMVGVALTIAKVFVIDMDGLTGLLRVASFLGLGLSLAGLGWINAKITVKLQN